MRIKVPSIAIVLLIVGTSLYSQAQIFRVQGGSSTLFGAEGGSVEIKAPTYEAQFGLGVLNGEPQYGFSVRTQLRGDTLTVGDGTEKVELPTDVFDSSHYFFSRGVGLLRTLPNNMGRRYAFLGTTSLGYSTPFFMASRSDTGLAILYVEQQLSDKLRFVSRNLFSKRQTSVHALEWTAAPGVKLAASAGIGSNQPYAASSLRLDFENLVLRAAYISEGDKFQRMQVATPVSTEPEKENIAAMYRVNKRVTLRGGHQNILQPETPDSPLLRARVDEGYATLNIARFDLGAGLIHSSTSVGNNTGTNLYATRALNRVLSVNANWYQSRPDKGPISNTLATTVREQLSQRYALTQTIVRSEGQTTAGFGGELVGNRISASVGYQTVYVPFRPEKAFQQALSFNARINLPRNMQLTAGSFVDPQGKVRYTIGIGTYLYRLRGLGPVSSVENFRFPKFITTGVVIDPNGDPIEGAAIHVDGRVAYSDSSGFFMVRLPRAGPHIVAVAFEEFTAPGIWEVVEAPASTLAQPEDTATPIRIVLRRLPGTRVTTPVPDPARE